MTDKQKNVFDTFVSILNYIGSSFKHLSIVVILMGTIYIGWQIHWVIELAKNDPTMFRQFQIYNPEVELTRQLDVDVVLDSLLESTGADRSQVWLLHNMLTSAHGIHFNRSSIYTEKTKGVPRFVDQHQREILTRNVLFLDEILDGQCVVREPAAGWTTRFMLVCPVYYNIRGWLGLQTEVRVHGYITLSYIDDKEFTEADIARLTRILTVHKMKIETILNS
jgi:hypothetical protein